MAPDALADGQRQGVLHPNAAAQFRAIAWLRWRLFVNTLRRRGGKAELVARVLFYPFLAVIFIAPVTGAGFLGYYAVSEHQSSLLFLLTWVVFSAWFFVTAVTSVMPPAIDLSLLLRFPMRFRSYVLLRFTLGVLATPNVVGSLALAGAAVGIGIAQPALFPWAALVLFSFALMMVLLLRMLLTWLDRWLAQRRTREIVGFFFAVFFFGFQYLNLRVQTMAHHHGRGIPHLERMEAIYHAARPVLMALPASLAAQAIETQAHGSTLAAIGAFAGLLAYGGAFAALFALRLRGEFHGENFNEAPARSSPAQLSGARQAAREGLRIPGLPVAVVACIGKELVYLKRAPATLLSMLTPLVLVAIYAGRLGTSDLTLPGALAYAMFSTVPMLYNALGQDAAGAQLYLLSPTPLRQVFLAKNIVSSGLILLVAVIATVIVVRNQPPGLPVALATLFWLGFVLFTNLSLGNYLSITAPRKIDPGKFSTRQQPSQISVWIVIGILLGSLMVGFAILWTSRYFGVIWVAPGILFVFGATALGVYLRSLRRIGTVVLKHRDALLESLCKS